MPPAGAGGNIAEPAFRCTCRSLGSKGDRVKTGQLIAEAAGYISANIHSSVTGKVLKLDEVYDASGYRCQAVIIEVEPADEWAEEVVLNSTLKRDCTLSPEEIIQKLRKRA